MWLKTPASLVLADMASNTDKSTIRPRLDPLDVLPCPQLAQQCPTPWSFPVTGHWNELQTTESRTSKVFNVMWWSHRQVSAQEWWYVAEHDQTNGVAQMREERSQSQHINSIPSSQRVIPLGLPGNRAKCRCSPYGQNNLTKSQTKSTEIQNCNNTFATINCDIISQFQSSFPTQCV